MIISFENYNWTKTIWLDKTNFRETKRKKQHKLRSKHLKQNNKYIIWLFSFSNKKKCVRKAICKLCTKIVFIYV